MSYHYSMSLVHSWAETPPGLRPVRHEKNGKATGENNKIVSCCEGVLVHA